MTIQDPIEATRTPFRNLKKDLEGPVTLELLGDVLGTLIDLSEQTALNTVGLSQAIQKLSDESDDFASIKSAISSWAERNALQQQNVAMRQNLMQRMMADQQAKAAEPGEEPARAAAGDEEK